MFGVSDQLRAALSGALDFAGARAARAPRTSTRSVVTVGDAEVQAECAAAAAWSDSAAVPQLGIAAPARVPDGAGPGVPLPAATRVRLERAFRADLGAVRLHRDVAAHRAAADHRARAFAAGVHVFVGADAGDLDTPMGRVLLAHEIAHVLQQTGRPGPDGRLHASDIRGGGEVQRESLPDLLERTGFFPAVPALDDVLQRHRDANPSDAALETELKRVKRILGKGWDTDASKVAKIKLAAESTKAAKNQRQLYIDCLKALGEYDAAAELLAMRWNIDTAFLSKGLYLAVRARKDKTSSADIGLDWLVERASKRTFTGWYYPKPFVDAYRTWLFSPFATMPNGSGGKNAPSALAEASKSTPSVTTTGLFDNETGVAAVIALMALDNTRVKADRRRGLFDVAVTDSGDLDISRGVFATGGTQFWQFKYLVAKEMVGTTADAWFGSDIEEVAVLARKVWPEIVEIAKQAVALGDRVTAIYGALGGTKDFENLGKAQDVLAGIAKDRRFAQLGGYLKALADQLAARPPGDEFAASYYPKLVGQLRANVRVYAKPFADALVGQFGPGANVDATYQLRLGFVLWLFGVIDQSLEEYSAETDKLYVATYKRNDVRAAHRARVMRMIGGGANLTGFTAVGDRVQKFLIPKQTVLALLGTFEPVSFGFSDAWVAARQDLSFKKPITQGEPLTVGIIESFIYALYYEVLKVALETELAKRRRKEVDPALDPVTVIATKSAESTLDKLKPRKWVMSAFDGYWSGGNELGKLVFAHPKYTEIEPSLKAYAPYWAIVPETEAVHRRYGITLWIFPAMDRLQELLAKDPALDKAAQAAWLTLRARAAANKKVLPEKPTWSDWFDALRLSTLGDPSNSKKPLPDAVTADPSLAPTAKADVEAKLKLERDRMVAKAREANNLERQATGKRIQVLKGWSEDNDRGDHLTKMLVPLYVARLIYNFARTVVPEEDAPYQVAALMLENGFLFNKEFGPQQVLLVFKTQSTQRGDIIAEYLPILRGTLTIWDDKGYHATLERLAWGGPLTGLSAVAMSGAASALRETLGDFEATKVNQQKDTGLAGKKGGAIRAWVYAREFKPLDRWKIDGVSYEMGEVLEDFEYHPTFIRKPSPIEWPQSNKAPDSLLTVGGVDVPGTARSSRVLFRIKRNGKDKDVTEKDDDLLAEISYVTAMQTIVEQLQALGVAIEVFAEVVMTGVEIVQPEIAAARIAASLLQFLVSDEFAALVEMARTDSWGLVKKIFDELLALIDVDKVLTWFFFGAGLTWADKVKDQPKTSAQDKVTQNEEQRTGSGAIAKIGAIIKRLIGFGKKVMLGFDAVRKVIQAPIRRAQDFIASHPILRVLLSWAVELYDRLKDLDWKKVLDDPVGALEGEAKTALQGVVDYMRDAFDKLKELELPEEVVPLQSIVDIAIDMGIDRLPAKYKLASKVVVGLLRTFGWWDSITGKITEQLKAVKADPNLIYVELVRKNLEKPFESYRDELVGAMTAVFKELKLDLLTQPKGTPINFSLFGEGSAEDDAGGNTEAPAQPALRGPGPAAVRAPSLDRVSGGVPLAPATRLTAESRFGHDFGHVRVHTGEQASAANAAVGSYALTKGSHVLLAPDVSPSTAAGARIMDHELGHVLQQTGPRPLGASQDPTPRGGVGQARVRVDAAAERAADRLAAGGPLARSAGFVQPSPRGMFGMFLAKTIEDHRIQARAERIDKAAKTPEALDTDSEALAKALADSLVTQIEDLVKDPTKNFEPPFNDTAAGAPTAIIDYLKKTRRLTSLKAAVPVLVARARRKLDMGKPPPDGPAPAPVYRVTPRNLELELEEYLFGLSGVAFEFVLQSKEEIPPGGKRARTVVDSGAAGGPVKSIKVRTLYMNFIGGNAELWDKVLDRTFAAEPSYTAKSKPDFRREARIALRVGDRATMWDSAKFAFSATLARAIKDGVNRPGALPPKDLPPASVYITTSPKDARVMTHKGASGHVGLRVGVYRDKGPQGDQNGVDRDSHHTTQFVLFEYLYGDKADLPVSPLTSFKDFIDVRGGRIHNITSSGGRTIQVAKFFGSSSDRGPEMPTVLIARRTHQSGNVHIPGEKPDEGPTGTPSQGGWVHNRFQDALTGNAGKIIKSEPTKLATIAAGGSVDAVTSNDIKDAIFGAACKTYKQMRDLMMPRLEAALATIETVYYNATAQAAGKDAQAAYQLTPDKAMGIMDAVKKNNDDILEGAAPAGAGLQQK